MNRPATLYEILFVKSSASKDQVQKLYHKMSLLTKPAGGDEEFFETINQAYQILTNDLAQEAYNLFGPDEAEKVMNNEISNVNCPFESAKFSYSRTFIYQDL